jgi:hypothetical protein
MSIKKNDERIWRNPIDPSFKESKTKELMYDYRADRPKQYIVGDNKWEYNTTIKSYVPKEEKKIHHFLYETLSTDINKKITNVEQLKNLTNKILFYENKYLDANGSKLIIFLVNKLNKEIITNNEISENSDLYIVAKNIILSIINNRKYKQMLKLQFLEGKTKSMFYGTKKSKSKSKNAKSKNAKRKNAKRKKSVHST